MRIPQRKLVDIIDVVINTGKYFLAERLVVEIVDSTEVVVKVGLHEGFQVIKIGSRCPGNVTRCTGAVGYPAQGRVGSIGKFTVYKKEKFVLDDGTAKAKTLGFNIERCFGDVVCFAGNLGSCKIPAVPKTENRTCKFIGTTACYGIDGSTGKA